MQVIKHNTPFYVDYRGEQYKVKVIDYSYTYCTFRVNKLWKWGIYMPHIWNAQDDGLHLAPRKLKEYSTAYVKDELINILVKKEAQEELKIKVGRNTHQKHLKL